MSWPTVLQVVESFGSEAEARAALEFQLAQVGAICGRVLSPSPEKPGWRLQAFHEVDRVDHERLREWMPDGCRLVVLPPALRRACEQAGD